MTGRLFLRKNQPLFVGLLVLFVSITTLPGYLPIASDPAPSATYPSFFRKTENLLARSDKKIRDTHYGKMELRLTVPLLARLLCVGPENAGKSVIRVFLLQSFLLIPFLFYFLKLLCEFSKYSSSALCMLGLSATYLVKAFLWDKDFWFDGFAYFFLLSGMDYRKAFVVFLFLQLACWTDETAFVALPGVYLFHVLRGSGFIFSCRSGLSDLFSKPAVAVVSAGIIYLAVRFILIQQYGLQPPAGADVGVSAGMVPFQLNNRLIGIFLAFEGLWLYFSLARYALAGNRNGRIIAPVLLLLMLVHVVVAYSVFDITRSLCYAFPLFITAYAVFAKSSLPHKRFCLLVASFLCLIIPTQYMILNAHQIPWSFNNLPEHVKAARALLHPFRG